MLNKVTIMGRLTGDADLRTVSNGETAVTSFTIACERNFKNKSGEKETDFFYCTAWKGTAEFIHKYFHKGSMIVIDGRLERDDYTDKDGNKRQNVQIIVENAYFGGGKSEGGNTKPNKEEADLSDFDEIPTPDEDDMPF